MMVFFRFDTGEYKLGDVLNYEGRCLIVFEYDWGTAGQNCYSVHTEADVYVLIDIFGDTIKINRMTGEKI